jgi:hypothetical protein
MPSPLWKVCREALASSRKMALPKERQVKGGSANERIFVRAQTKYLLSNNLSKEIFDQIRTARGVYPRRQPISAQAYVARQIRYTYLATAIVEIQIAI